MALPKWTDERVQQLTETVGTETPVSVATVARAAEVLETTTRSVASKLRKEGYRVEKASSVNTKVFSDEQAATLREFVEGNSGQFTYGEIAENFADGQFSPRAIQGKILSMELTSHVKPTPKPESQRTYSDDEHATVVRLIGQGASVETIADKLNRPVNSIRGKALSLLRSGEITSMPKQETKAEVTDVFDSIEDIESLTVEQIAEATGRTVRGVKTTLTRRGIKVVDHDGAAKREKIDNSAAAA